MVINKEELCPTLSQAKDWPELKSSLSLAILMELEEIVQEYEAGYQYEDYPLIIEWWEGLVDTKEVIEQYSMEV